MKKLWILALLSGSLLFSLNLVERGFTYDEALYLSIGRNLSLNFSDYTMNSKYMLYRPPILPYLIGITSRLTGGFSEGISMLITPFFSFLLILLLYTLTRHYYGENTAFFSALLLILCPLYVRHSIRVLNHIEFALLFFLSLFCFRKGSHWYWYILSGILGGLAFLTRYTGLMYFAVTGIYLLLEKKTDFYKEKRAYLAFFSFLIPVLPWAFFSDKVYDGYFEFAKVAFAAIPTDSSMYTPSSTSG